MRVKSKFIFLNNISALLLILILSVGLVNNKIEDTVTNNTESISIVNTSLFSAEESRMPDGRPVSKDKQDKKAISINIEEEVDFLEGYNLSPAMLIIPIITSQMKAVKRENSIVLFHPELLVPPPKV
jgi:hypothetical protein